MRLPAELSDEDALAAVSRMQLGALADRIRGSAAAAESAALGDRRASVRALRAASRGGRDRRTPDLSGIEERHSGLARSRRGSPLQSATLSAGSTSASAHVAAAIEAQEDDATEILAGPDRKIDSLADAIDAQDAPGARRDIERLDSKLDQLGAQLAAHAEHLSRRQIEPLEARLDDMQAQPRGAGESGRPDSARAAGAARRDRQPLELLKGRSIDPGASERSLRSVDAAMRAIPEERFERLEQKIEEMAVPAERFDRLEKKIAEAAVRSCRRALRSLERKLDEIGRTSPPAASSDAGGSGRAPRRYRCAPARAALAARLRPGRGEPRRADADDRQAARAASAGRAGNRRGPRGAGRADRPAHRRSGHSRMALAQIETSLKTIEERLDDTRRSLDAAARRATSRRRGDRVRRRPRPRALRRRHGAEEHHRGHRAEDPRRDRRRAGHARGGRQAHGFPRARLRRSGRRPRVRPSSARMRCPSRQSRKSRRARAGAADAGCRRDRLPISRRRAC